MRLAFVLLTLGLVLNACGGGAAASSIPSGDPVLVIADGPIAGVGMTVAEALTHRPTDDLVTVSGALFVSPDGSVRLCDAIAESFPPQCGGERIRVEGLDLASVAELQTEGDVSWAEGVTLHGSVE